VIFICDSRTIQRIVSAESATSGQDDDGGGGGGGGDTEAAATTIGQIDPSGAGCKLGRKGAAAAATEKALSLIGRLFAAAPAGEWAAASGAPTGSGGAGGRAGRLGWRCGRLGGACKRRACGGGGGCRGRLLAVRVAEQAEDSVRVRQVEAVAHAEAIAAVLAGETVHVVGVLVCAHH